MAAPRTRVLPLLALAAAVAGTLAVGASAAPPPSARADEPATWSFAVTGDVPYGPALEETFPAFVASVNADPDVRTVTHLGDIKSGSTPCDDARFARVRRAFDGFEDPLVYTPGDNEWTDCHRPAAGGYRPLERLDRVRRVFFDRPGHTLGADAPVTSQAGRGVPENVRWERDGLSFATLHVVGSDDDLAPWTGLGETAPTRAQLREERARMAASIANLRAAFATARAHDDAAVVLQQQADMFDETVADPAPADYRAFRPLVRALVQESRAYDGRVWLFNGDSHRFRQDAPLAAGSRWLAFYGVDGHADNLTRVTVEGSDEGTESWLKVTARPGSGDLALRQVPVG